MSDNMAITTHEMLGTDEDRVADTHHRLHGKSVPYGFAGYQPLDAGFALCPECVFDDSEIESALREDTGGIIYGNSETNHPGTTCEDCGRYLDTYIVVYKHQDPRLFWRIEQSESVGMNDKTGEIEEIAKELAVRAYEMGWAECGEMHEGTYGPGGEFEGEIPELPTDSAHYANNIAPSLRALSGHHDNGTGCYTDAYVDLCHLVLDEDIHPAFRRGYTDRLEGRDYNPEEGVY